MTAIDAQALGDMMDGDEGQLAGAILESDRRARQAEQELAEKHAQLVRAVAVLRFAQTTVADCVDLLDRRANTPEYNRERSRTKLLILAKELAKLGLLS